MSDYTTTPNYGLYKPTPNADVDSWGTHLNSNFDTLDTTLPTFLPLTGGTMTGPLNFASANNYLQYTTTGTARLRYMVGAAEALAISDNGGLSVSTSLAPNVRFYGAVMDGVAFDNAAYDAARAVVGTNGSVSVPYGRQRLSVNPTSGPSTQVLWKMDGTYIGVGGATPVTGVGTDVVENFFGGNKFFGRSNSFGGVAPVLRVDSVVNHTGGTAGGAISTVRVNTTTSSTAVEACFGVSSVVTDGRSVGNCTALNAYNVRNATRGAAGGLAYGINTYVNDTTESASSVAGAACGIEDDIIANGLDDGGLAGTYVPAGQGIRTIFQAVGAQSNTSGADCEIGWGVRVTPTAGSTHVVFKRQFAAIGRFNKAAFSTEYATAESGANAIWLATGHIVALDTAGTAGAAKVTLSSDGNNLKLGTVPVNAANDAAAATALVPVGGVYRNGSVLMVRVV